jgi:hypothetical protein
VTAAEMAQLVIGLGSLSLALLALAALLIYVLITWSVRRQGDRYDRRWGLGAYNEGAVTDTLAAAGVEARAGCTCECCEHLRATAAEVMFHVTDDDIAELNRYGIAWEAK